MITGPAAVARRDGSTDRALSALALRLATGRQSPALADADWSAVYRVALRERIAALAWLRSGAVIARAAESEVAEAWRAAWLGSAVRAARTLALTGELAAAVEAAEGHLVVLKGAPLADLLYGDVAARPSTDIDAFVAASHRAVASRAAARFGWRGSGPDDSGDEMFSRLTPDGEIFLELHGSLLGERLSYLPVPQPQFARRRVDGIELDVHAGPLLPAYLAVHLATHSLPPLLWWLDWWTLWGRLDAAERREALTAARAAGLARYLRWAQGRITALERAIDGDDVSLGEFGFSERGGRRDSHQLVRHVTLAPTVRASTAAIRQWARPRWAAETDGGVVVGSVRRLGRHWRLLLPVSDPRTEQGFVPPARRKSVDELLSVVRTVTELGGEIWIEVTGSSMFPAICAGDRVLLRAPRRRPRAGAVVLAATDSGPVLHRVVVARGSTFVTQGDACSTRDAGLSPASILAQAVAVRRAGRVVALTPTFDFGAAALWRLAVASAFRRRRRAAIE